MEYCTYNRICANKISCLEWTDVGTCDYYGHYRRVTPPEKTVYHMRSQDCQHLTRTITPEHQKLCEDCDHRFYCWTSEYWGNDMYEQHKHYIYVKSTAIARARNIARQEKEARLLSIETYGLTSA